MRLLNNIVIILPFILSSCFEEDERVPPYTPPEGVVSVQIEQSIYTHHVFYDFSEASVVSSYPNDAWQLAFESSSEGWHVRVNSSGFWGVKETSLTTLEDSPGNISSSLWNFDNSNGNLDSTAIGNWVTFSATDTLISSKIFAIGQYDGIEYSPAYLIQFSGISGTEYMFNYKNINESEVKHARVQKNVDYNFVYYSLRNQESLLLEPPKDMWDMEFSQYATILLDNQGVPTPYFVRGVLLNSTGVSAAVDSSAGFFDWTMTDALSAVYSDRRDFIGHEWKDVEINEGSNTATYEVNRDILFTINDSEKNFFKLRFRSYHNELGQKGYPLFEFSILSN